MPKSAVTLVGISLPQQSTRAPLPDSPSPNGHEASAIGEHDVDTVAPVRTALRSVGSFPVMPTISPGSGGERRDHRGQRSGTVLGDGDGDGDGRGAIVLCSRGARAPVKFQAKGTGNRGQLSTGNSDHREAEQSGHEWQCPALLLTPRIQLVSFAQDLSPSARAGGDTLLHGRLGHGKSGHDGLSVVRQLAFLTAT